MNDFKPGLWYTTEGHFGFLDRKDFSSTYYIFTTFDGTRIIVDYDGWISDKIGFLKTARIGQERFVKGTEIEWPKVSEEKGTGK